MAFPYQPLKDVRTNVPLGENAIVEPLAEIQVTSRQLQAGDFESLIRDIYQRVDCGKSTKEKAPPCTLNHVGSLEPQELFVSAESSKNQLLSMMSGFKEGQHDYNEVTEKSSEAETFASNSNDEAAVGNEQNPKRERFDHPDHNIISRERWEVQPQHIQYQCSFDAIRLLVLHSGSQDDLIHCQMETAYIRHYEEGLEVLDQNPLGEDPVYEALSYCWGDPIHKTKIQVGDHFVEVGINLESALRSLRRLRESRKLWVDALCINQSDDKEKSIQVSRMFEIYEQAAHVLIWLGPASTDSDLAMKTLNSLGTVNGEMFVDDIYNGLHVANKLWIRPRDPSKLRSASTISNGERTALENFFRYRQWWSRRWIIQEIVHANRAYLVCGSLALDWDVLSNLFRLNVTAAEAFRGCWWLRSPYALDQQRQQTHAPLLLAGFRRQGTTLRSLISRFEGYQCSDPRDLIYSLLGLSSFPRGRIAADYSKSPREVLIETAKEMIYDYNSEGRMIHPSLNIVCYAYRARPSAVDLPSWVADWSVPCNHLFVDISESNNQLYNCSGDEPFLNDLSFPDNNTLQCKAIILDHFALVRQKVYGSENRTRKETVIGVTHLPLSDMQKDSLHRWGCALKQHSVFRGSASWLSSLKAALGQSGYMLKSSPDDAGTSLTNTTTERDAASSINASDLEDISTLMARIFEDSRDVIVPEAFILSVTLRGLVGFVPETTVFGTRDTTPAIPGFAYRETGGDSVAILYGANVPVVLRKVTLSAPALSATAPISIVPESYKIIGPAYIDGIMHGEALDMLEELGVEPKLVRLV